MAERHTKPPPRRCSLNVPIMIDGNRSMATAGHCRSNGRAHAEALYFSIESDMGETYTSTWPGNTLQLGDWRLLRGRGGNYSPNIFRGGITGSETAPIVEATWSQPPLTNPSALPAERRAKYADTALCYGIRNIRIAMDGATSPLCVFLWPFATTQTWMAGSIAMAGGAETQGGQSIAIFQATPQTA